MNRMILAGLALACACSPALAAVDPAFDSGRAFGHILLTILFGSALIAATLVIVRRAAGIGLAVLAATMIVGVGLHPAFAQTAAEATSGVTVPYGQWIVDFGPQIAGWAATAFAAIASVAIAKWVPWASSIATQQRIQMAAEALAQYAIRAIPDSTKDGKVTINAGPAVVAEAVQHGVDVLPKKVLDAMQKGGGMASIIFRVLDLEDGASKHNVLAPAADKLNARGIPTKA